MWFLGASTRAGGDTLPKMSGSLIARSARDNPCRVRHPVAEDLSNMRPCSLDLVEEESGRSQIVASDNVMTLVSDRHEVVGPDEVLSP